jgi:type IV pilus assembly protein PilW
MNNSLNPISMPRRHQSGFTMVELMVGVLVGLVATVVMFQVFAVSEGQKRTTTGAGDAQQSGLVSLFQMERDIRMAGYGLNLPAMLGCTTYGWNETAGGGFNLPLAPVIINNGVAGAADTITVIYGNSDMIGAPERLRNPVTTSAGIYQLNNRYGYNVGDVVVLAEVGKTCTMAQVSALAGTADLQHTSGGYVDSQGQPQVTKYNGVPGAFPGYAAWIRATNMGGRIFNLGNAPTLVTYSIRNNTLVSVDATAPASTPVVVADNIVQMQAQYGYDGDGNGRITAPSNVAVLNPLGVDQWADSLPAGAGAVNWTRITSIRLAIVARSVTPEKRNAAGNCVTSMNGPRWYARDAATPYYIDVSGTGTDWGCFRYRVFEVTIPIRNVAWYPFESL